MVVTGAWGAAGPLARSGGVGGQYDYAWGDDGQVVSVVFPNQVTTAWDYDDAGRGKPNSRGQTVVVRGAVVDGVPRAGTAFTP
ncbi:MAG: hypothetical protein FWH11_02795 [Micrococcales bacterium]|nr:hypothetical protein [Micrococcales bacterium]